MKKYSKKYNIIFSSLHTLYRLVTSFNKPNDFIIGIAKLYKNTFNADKVTLIYKLYNSSRLIKEKIKDNTYTLKRGGISILTKEEKEMFERSREIISDKKLATPLIFVKTLGVIFLERKKTPFSDIEKRWFASLSEQVSISFKIIGLHLEEQRMLINYIKTLSKMLKKSIPTPFHQPSISRLIKNLGKELKLSEREIRSLELASLLHDAGKIHLPLQVLEKKEPLTEEEIKLITEHPQKGVEIIKNLEILKPVIPILLYHHERFDGKGYPSGLKKKKIPLGSRILAVIDAFNAMFFGRPYKEKMSLDEIEKELKKQKGTQFDPQIIDAFVKILRKKNIRNYLNSLI